MNISEKELFFIQNVFNLARFNSLTRRYELPEEAYAKVDFTDEKTVKMFEKLCKQYSIYYDRTLMFKIQNKSNNEIKKEAEKLEEKINVSEKEVNDEKVEKTKKVSFIFDDVSNVEVVDINNIKNKFELFQYLDNTFIPAHKFYQLTLDNKTGKNKYIDTINLNDLSSLNLSEDNMILAIEHLFDLNISLDTKNGLDMFENDKYQYLIKSKFTKQLFGEKTNWDIVKPLFEEYDIIKNDLKNCTKEEKSALEEAKINKRNQILLANTRLIDYYIMRHFVNNELPDEDIKQIAYKIVEEKFIDNFDLSKGFRFSTYLYSYLGHHIIREINDLKAFRIPVYAMDMINKIEKVANVIMEIKGSVTPDEIAIELDMPVEKVVELLRAKQEQDFESLTDYEDNWLLDEEDYFYHDNEYLPESWENDDSISESFISEVNVEDLAYNTLLKEQIKEVLHTLHPREAKVLTLRFGLNGEYPRSLEEVGSEFGVTKERVRQIEAKALRKLRHPSRSKRLEGYLDNGFSR